MSSRQDQAPSGRSQTRRAVAALVAWDPDQTPFRVTTAAALIGVLLAAVAVAGATAWRGHTGGAPPEVTVEQEGRR